MTALCILLIVNQPGNTIGLDVLIFLCCNSADKQELGPTQTTIKSLNKTDLNKEMLSSFMKI